MSRKIRKSVKKYNRGISKAIPPRVTLQTILKKIDKLEPAIFKSYSEIKAKTKIPQCIIKGTDYYSQIINDIGRTKYSINSAGKGHFKTEAHVSGLMELIERYSCIKYLFHSPNKATISTFEAKNKHYGLEEFYSNPFYRKSVDLLSTKDVEYAKLLWYKTMTIDGKEIYLPLSLISYTYEYTNGMAAGNTFEEALSHGICEVVERHVQTVVQENKLVTPTINQKSIRSLVIQGLLGKFKAINQKVTLKDLSLGMGIPIIGVVRKADIGRYFITVGVAPNREEAMIRALVENSQIEPHVGPHITHKEGWKKSSIKHYLQESKKINYRDLPNIHNIDTKKEIYSLKSLLENHGMKIYYVDTTDPKLKIPSVLVYITKTKCFFEHIHHRNIIMGLVEESFKIKDYKQALKYVQLGERLDPKNIEYYRFYKGLVYAFRKKYTEAIRIFGKLPKNKLYEFESIVDIHIGICHLALGNLDKTFEYFINNIKRYLDIKFVFIRSHHHYDKEIFNNAQEIYSTLQLKLHPLRKKKQ